MAHSLFAWGCRSCSSLGALPQIVAMQLQHEQIMQNLRSSNMVEIRRALHNQSVDLARQHHSAEYVAKGQAIAARDQAVLELQELQQLHNELNIKVCSTEILSHVWSCRPCLCVECACLCVHHCERFVLSTHDFVLNQSTLIYCGYHSCVLLCNLRVCQHQSRRLFACSVAVLQQLVPE